jgi:outer membrane immunogenic protein
MKRLAILFAATVFAAPALAADITYDEPPAPAPVDIAPTANWTGAYVGGQVGGALGGSKGAAGVDDFGGATDTFHSRSGGVTAGVQAGYDYQMPNNVIVGGVADFNYIDHDRKSGVVLQQGGSATGVEYETKTQMKYFGTVRGKVGYGMDRVAVYGTGGLAYGHAKVKTQDDNFNTEVDGSGTTFVVDSDKDKDKVGYTLGAGVDVLATPNVSFGLEYLYTDLGKAKSTSTFTEANSADPETFTTKSKTDLDFHTVMAKAAYRFN